MFTSPSCPLHVEITLPLRKSSTVITPDDCPTHTQLLFGETEIHRIKPLTLGET